MTHFILVKIVKNYLVLKYHILVPLVHLCILLTVLGQILLFYVNLLAKYSSAPTQRHWNGIKHILRYLQGTTYMSLFYSKESKQQLFRYAYAGYISDPHKVRSQTGYVFNLMELLFYEDPLSKQWWPHHQIIKRL